MVHKKEEGTYHCIEKLMKEMPGFFSPWERLASPLQELIRSREFLTDPKQHTGSLLLNASWHHLRPLSLQDLGRGQVLPCLGLCLGVAALKKRPQAGPSATHPRGWGQPPTRGQLLFHGRIPPLLSYNHQSHTTTTAIHTMTTALTHTALTHTTPTLWPLLSHYDQ